MSSAEQAIRKLIAEWHGATASGDVDAVLELMSEDVVFLVAGQPPMRGRQTFEKGLRGLLQQHRIESRSEIREIEVSGDWAYCWSQLTVKIIPLGGGLPFLRVGNTLSILHKGKNGSWLIVRDANMLAPVESQNQ